ncbi:hypothetical protein CU097_013533, partial [Rhizopus azygosporus]
RNNRAPLDAVNYARKSRTAELPDTKTHLMQKMVESLLTPGRCSKIYVPTECNSDESLKQQNIHKFTYDYIHSIRNNIGNMQGIKGMKK